MFNMEQGLRSTLSTKRNFRTDSLRFGRFNWYNCVIKNYKESQ